MENALTAAAILHLPPAAPREPNTFEIRPFGATSILMLRRTGNKLFQSLAPGEQPASMDVNDPDTFFALLAYLYLHAVPLGTAMRASHATSAEFEVMVAEFFETISPAELVSLTEQVSEHIAEVKTDPRYARGQEAEREYSTGT